MKEAGVAPPGVMPIQQPTRVPRSAVRQYLGSSAQVCSTTLGLILAFPPLKARPSSMVIRISPTPNSPMTATRKSKPRISSTVPKVIRSCPVTPSRPTAARAKPSIMAAMVLPGKPLVIPTKLAKVRNWTAKNSAGPKRRANFATSGARKVMTPTAMKAPTKDDEKAAVSASPARPFWASG